MRSARRSSSTSPRTRCSTAGSSRSSSGRSTSSASAASASRRSRRGCSPTSTSTASRRARARRENSSLSPDLLTEQALGKIRALNEIAQGRGQTLAQMALAWTLRDPRMTSTLVGASSVAQLEDSLGALAGLDFSDDELAEIDRYATDGGINLWARSSADLASSRTARRSSVAAELAHARPPAGIAFGDVHVLQLSSRAQTQERDRGRFLVARVELEDRSPRADEHRAAVDLVALKVRRQRRVLALPRQAASGRAADGSTFRDLDERRLRSATTPRGRACARSRDPRRA